MKEDPDREKGDWPDLLLIAGGAGQGSAVRLSVKQSAPLSVEQTSSSPSSVVSNSENRIVTATRTGMPPLRFTDFAGEAQSIPLGSEDRQGKPTLISLWASWCQPCIREMPDSKIIQEKFKNKDLKFLFISVDHDEKNWEKANPALSLGQPSIEYLRDQH